MTISHLLGEREIAKIQNNILVEKLANYEVNVATLRKMPNSNCTEFKLK